ncbi:hypothetical protein HRG_005022 [Hirsutella rhossiliensis]|uniref:Rhodopsin domain-containing protein n=1 Tax=Hirsutella rhossiliensis TaxID=111463 RepID=A0A9P8SJW1_9HYPO|nr:uncharacterized protein HRG_05022 [Hirsutella rhossiliensis]KAH0964594.1 hypothetical protein HRG_05022 [Hirsutella rhossiliensis]
MVRIGPGVSNNVFLGAVWATAALAFAFLLVRLYSRFRGPRRLYWDDLFVIVAFALALVTAALWQWVAPDMYYLLNVAAGFAPPTPDVFDRQRVWLRVSLVVELFFYTSLTAVKLAFLFFFRRLGHNVPGQKYMWWPIFLFTLAIWVASMGNVQYRCLVGPVEDLNGYCGEPSAIEFTTITLKVNCALDIFSDFLIMLIPITLLWNDRIQWAKKFAFIGLFSLSVVTMIIATVRVADINSTKWDNGQNDPTYLWLWSAIEPCIAIVVSCLSAFPQLFAQSARSANPVFKPTDTYYRRLKASMQPRRKQTETALSDLSGLTKTDDLDYARGPDLEGASHESQRPVLVPGSPKPAAVCYSRPAGRGDVGHGDGIKQELEYSVTKQPA